MSLGLTKPGASATLRHPKTGAVLAPLGYTKAGKAIMPILGASSEDEDDPAFTGGDSDPGTRQRRKPEDDDTEDDDDLDEDEDDEEDDKSKSRKSKKDDDEGSTRPERQAARYRVKLREAEARERALADRLRAIEDSDKPADELMTRDLAEARDRITNLTDTNRVLTSQLAFFKANTVSWVDPSDAFALADRAGLFDEIVDEDGNVDTRELDRALRALAKKKPHLVKKSASRARDDEDDDAPSSSASPMNGSRRGATKKTTDRASLAKRFPVLGK